MTLKPLANFLQVELKNVHKKNMTEHIYMNVSPFVKISFLQLIDQTMAGMEDIAGMRGHHWLRNLWVKLIRTH